MMNAPVYGCDGCRGTLGSFGCPVHGPNRVVITGPLLPDLTPAGLERSGDLAERMDQAPVEDVLRILAAAAHSLWHRAPRRATHDELVRELLEGIDEAHAAGLP